MGNNNINIGSLLKEIRLSNNLTQDEFAKRLDIPRSTYANYENSKREPSIEILNLISKEFKVDIFTFLNTNTYSIIDTGNGLELSDPYAMLKKTYNDYLNALMAVSAMEGKPISFLCPADKEILMNASYSIHHSLIETINQVSPIQDRMLNYINSQTLKDSSNIDKN